MKKIICSLLLLMLAPWAMAQQASPEALFKQWDKNKDGKLLPGELPQSARRNFAKVDTNKDGAISLGEHVRFLKRPRMAQPRQPKGVNVRPVLMYEILAVFRLFLGFSWESKKPHDVVPDSRC